MSLFAKTKVRAAVACCGIALVAASCSPAPSSSLFDVVTTNNIVYGQGLVADGANSADLRLNLHTPDAAGAHPLVVVIHGGGFVVGNKEQMDDVAEEFAANGFAAASIEYRLANDNPAPSARILPVWNAAGGASAADNTQASVTAIDDVLTAISHLVARPEVDGSKIFLTGRSAGAITALNVGYRLDDFGVAVQPITGVLANAGAFYGSTPDGTIFEGPTDPALFAVHGDADTLVPYSDAQQYVNEATAAGVDTEFQTIPGGGHPINLFNSNVAPGVSVIDRMVDWTNARS